MPELPEVETVRSGLEKELGPKAVIKKVKLMRKDVRFVIPPELPFRLANQPIIAIRRRAKYLLFETPSAILLNHLGMTGSWRFVNSSADEDKHDHCYIDLVDGRRLAFRDPRRFGVLDLIDAGQEAAHKLLKALGPEPLDLVSFTAEMLFKISRKRIVPVKALIMDQRVVVGIGNIYASEVLHRAGVKPARAAGRLKIEECEKIVQHSREILTAAIAAGGSSIRDYRDASGAEGGFQHSHLVYDRGGDACRTCGGLIKSKVIGGRSTYWCASCQK